MSTSTEVAAAKKRVKQIDRSIAVFERAIGIMEVDGWFGKGEPVKGLSECLVTHGQWGSQESYCADGGAVCAGMAIWGAARDAAKALRWNTQKTMRYIENQLDLFSTLNGIEVRPSSTLRGIASWNDYEVTYPEVKEAFGTALKALTKEKWELITTHSIRVIGIDQL